MTLLSDILTYPFRGGGKYLLFFGVLISLGSELMAYAPFIGILGRLILAGFLVATYFAVIETTATGSEEAPFFPEISNLWEDLIWPLLKTLIVGFVSFLPASLYLWLVPAPQQSLPIHLALLGCGLIYLPMAMLAVVVLGYLGALSPHIVLPAIFRAGGLYAFAVSVIAILIVVEVALEWLLGRWPLILTPVALVFGMAALLWNGRTLGIIYRERREEMGWM